MKIVKSVFIVFAAFLFVACGTTGIVPITGRKHSLLVSDAQILALSKAEYSKFMSQSRLSSNAHATAMVRRVGERLARSVEKFLKDNGNSNEIKNFDWEFNLVSNPQRNAFCMPGGKIVVYEGILPITQDESSLAIVLGHEIAHAVAKHSAEQMSKKLRQQYGTQIGYSVLQTMGAGDAATIAGVVAQGYFSFKNLSYSRENETEADHIGLIFAAMAGYDPTSAIGFWQRMASLSGNSGSDILSSHPSDEKRIVNIRRLMPQALKYYNEYNKTDKTKLFNKKSSRKYVRNKVRNSTVQSISANDLYNGLTK